jgi:hypothetical protein
LSLDGIRIIEKKTKKSTKFVQNKTIQSPGSNKLGIDSISYSKKNQKTKSSGFFSYKQKNIDNDSRSKHTPLFNKRSVLVALVTLIVVVLGSITAYSFNLFTNSYDFLKLFNSGRYLILFQNNTEMRATGGFIGSYAILEMKNGAPEKYYFETDVHKLDDAFCALESIAPPMGLEKIVDKWLMEDSNWSVDFPEAAQKVSWFYEHEKEVVSKNNPTDEEIVERLKQSGQFDGIVAINATVMADILNITGPIALADYNTTINSDNFLDVTQFQVEREYWKNPVNRVINEPKSILKDMLPKVISQISSEKKYNQVIDLVKKELQEKQILFYFYDDNKEKIALENGWAGEIKQTDGDYLYVNNSNIGTNKSSLNVTEDIKINASIDGDGTVLDNLTITRTHTGNGEWPDGENINYMRILVPYGSQLITAKLDSVDCSKDVITTKEAGKYVFAINVDTKPRSSRILNITYRLPAKINKDNYSIYVQKQPGNLGDNLEVIVNGQIKFDGILNIDRKIK